MEDEFKLPVNSYVICDVQSLFFGCQESFGRSRRTDFLKLKRLIEGYLVNDPYQSFALWKAYLYQYKDHDATNFSLALQDFGWTVREAPYPGGKGWSSEIISEVVAKNQRFQRFILVSGVGDLIKGVEVLKELGKEVWVIAYPSNMNARLAQLADRTIQLTEDVVWQTAEVKYLGHAAVSAIFTMKTKSGKEYSEHHIWCNFATRPLENCPQCPGMWEKYPYETEEEMNNLAAKYFPDARRVR